MYFRKKIQVFCLRSFLTSLLPICFRQGVNSEWPGPGFFVTTVAVIIG